MLSNSWAGCSGVTEPRHHLTGLLALHDLQNGVLQNMQDEGCGGGLHILLHERAGQGGGSEQRSGLIWGQPIRGNPWFNPDNTLLYIVLDLKGVGSYAGLTSALTC